MVNIGASDDVRRFRVCTSPIPNKKSKGTGPGQTGLLRNRGLLEGSGVSARTRLSMLADAVAGMSSVCVPASNIGLKRPKGTLCASHALRVAHVWMCAFSRLTLCAWLNALRAFQSYPQQREPGLAKSKAMVSCKHYHVS
jgi:hypothetical protein